MVDTEEKNNYNQYQQKMIRQKNHMDPATTVPSSSGKWGWFWASVEVYIQNLESIWNGYLYEGNWDN